MRQEVNKMIATQDAEHAKVLKELFPSLTSSKGGKTSIDQNGPLGTTRVCLSHKDREKVCTVSGSAGAALLSLLELECETVPPVVVVTVALMAAECAAAALIDNGNGVYWIVTPAVPILMPAPAVVGPLRQ
jgi:hypothetical protein